jgi:hypothetical protein
MQLQFMLTAAATFLVAPSMSLDNLGAYDKVEVGPKETQLLTKALGDDAFYAPTVTTHACFVEIDSIGTQVVSGTKYKFNVKACTTTSGKSGAGKCAGENANCKAEPMVVMLFEQPWTETLQIMSIEKDASAGPVKKEVVDSAKSASSDGSSVGAKAAPVMVTMNNSSSASSAGMVEVAPTKKPAATSKSPAPLSAVPSPSPKSGAASVSTASAATALALGVAAIVHSM